MCIANNDSGVLCKAKGQYGNHGDLCMRHWIKYMHSGHVRAAGDKSSPWYNFKAVCDGNRRLLELGRSARVRRIQRVWRRAVSDPSYKICRDRLMREYGELVLS